MSAIRARRPPRGLVPSERSARLLRWTAYAIAAAWSVLTLFPLIWMY